MPQIIVTAGPTDQHGSDTVMLRERVNPADFESEQFAANLVERLGWAVLDAIEAERDQRGQLAAASERPASQRPAPEDHDAHKDHEPAPEHHEPEDDHDPHKDRDPGRRSFVTV